MFKRQMREVPGGKLKFGHNYEAHDNSFETSHGFWIKNGLDRTRPNVQKNRMNGLLQSGILCLWVKWENIRSELRRRYEKKETDEDQDFKGNENSSSYEPFSMNDPCIYLIFYLSASMFLLSGVLFSFEMIVGLTGKPRYQNIMKYYVTTDVISEYFATMAFRVITTITIKTKKILRIAESP